MENLLYITFLFFQRLIFSEGSFSRVNGILGTDISLPCTFPVAVNFNLQDLVITWQRTASSIVVHSFYNEENHPEYQDSAFRGRTKLFPQEFPRGNAAVRLKGATMSDQGNYTCYVIQEDGKGYIEHLVELQLYEKPLVPGTDDKNPALERKNPEFLMAISGGILIVLITVGVGLCRKQKTKSQYPDEEMPLLGDVVEGNELSSVLCSSILGYIMLLHLTTVIKSKCNRSLPEAIQIFKEYIMKNTTNCFDKVSQRKPKTYSSLARTVNVTCPKEQGTLDDFVESGASGIEREVNAAHLLSLPQEKMCSSQRVLLIGDAGVGKSWAATSIQQEWAASRPSPPVSCVIVFRFYDLNRIEGKSTLRKLFKKQCAPLSTVLTELLSNPRGVLIILDGLDEFSHQLQWDSLDGDFNIDTEAEVNILVSKIISKDLLKEAQVLVTSRWNTKPMEANKKYFDCVLVISGFTNDQLRRYCELFYQGKEKAAKMYQHITENDTINYLTSNPLNSYILCNILDRCSCSLDAITHLPATNSKVFLLFLYSLVNCDATEKLKSETEQKLLKDTILNLGELCFNSLLSGKLEMKTDDLDAYGINPEVLSAYFSNLILEKTCEGQSTFEFQHVVLKEQFAALYCATSLKDDTEELIKNLDLWCFGKMPLNQKSQYYLRAFKPEDTEKMDNFTRLLMGSLTAGKDSTLWNCNYPLTRSTARALITWFKSHLEQDIKKTEMLSLMRCLFELHDSTVTAAVSPHIKHVDFFNISLSPLDLTALRYCLSHSTVDTLDLRLCTLGDFGIQLLKEILFKCKTVSVSSNKLTEKSAEILSEILQRPQCNIETLSCGTNSFGSKGTQFLWKALAKNQSLKFLRLYDNQITDEGTENMVQHLRCNRTLEKVYLCANKFGDQGWRNIQEAKKLLNGLEIVTKIVEEEDLLLRVETQAIQLLSQSHEYNQEWLQKIMESILKDLGDESDITDQRTKTRVGNIKENINKLLCKEQTMSA
ncbi:nucleotide-binding oligomerization domain-containing protein 1-like [Scyliorhinus canicula]|uniref:nucleotide-binding oligomerization domain-containing protein 1-like n=1 Tax=Scyliorhinus canicula TaxID=7830 RepID=UPI0018F5EE92|nr:nucleotide-binding oligomerization domain-containing protein 1-like [Scyliorhinus canicula]